MPAKKQITTEKILSEALKIVRERGIDNLNMRTLAKACNCSTQPIYLSYKGMDDLKTDINNEITHLFEKCIEREIASGKYVQYKAVGMGYIKFAKEEKELFKYLMMTNHQEDKTWMKLSYDVSTNIIKKDYGLIQSNAEKLHTELWIFVHGIASMFATDYINWDWETVSSLVTEAYFGFMSRIKGEDK